MNQCNTQVIIINQGIKSLVDYFSNPNQKTKSEIVQNIYRLNKFYPKEFNQLFDTVFKQFTLSLGKLKEDNPKTFEAISNTITEMKKRDSNFLKTWTKEIEFQYDEIKQANASINLSSLDTDLKIALEKNYNIKKREVKITFSNIILNAIIQEDKLITNDLHLKLKTAFQDYFQESGIIEEDESIEQFLTKFIDSNSDIEESIEESKIVPIAIAKCFNSLFQGNNDPLLKDLLSLIKVDYSKDFFEKGRYSIIKQKAGGYNQFEDDNQNGLDYVRPLSNLVLGGINLYDSSKIKGSINPGYILSVFNKAKNIVPPLDSKGVLPRVLSDVEWFYAITSYSGSKLTEFEKLVLKSLAQKVIELQSEETKRFKPNTITRELLDTLLLTQEERYCVINGDTGGITELKTTLGVSSAYTFQNKINQVGKQLVEQENAQEILKQENEKVGFKISRYSSDELKSFTMKIGDLEIDLSKAFSLMSSDGIFGFEEGKVKIHNTTADKSNVNKFLSNVLNSKNAKKLVSFINYYTGSNFTVEGIKGNTEAAFTEDDLLFNSTAKKTNDNTLDYLDRLRYFFETAVQVAYQANWMSNPDLNKKFKKQLFELKKSSTTENTVEYLVGNDGEVNFIDNWPTQVEIGKMYQIYNGVELKSVFKNASNNSVPKNRLSNMMNDRYLLLRRNLPEHQENNIFYNKTNFLEFYEGAIQISEFKKGGEVKKLSELSEDEFKYVFSSLMKAGINSSGREFESDFKDGRVIFYPSVISDKTSFYGIIIDLNKLKFGDTPAIRLLNNPFEMFKNHVNHVLQPIHALNNQVLLDLRNNLQFLKKYGLLDESLMTIDFTNSEDLTNYDQVFMKYLYNNEEKLIEALDSFKRTPKRLLISKLGENNSEVIKDVKNLPDLVNGLHYGKSFNYNLYFKAQAYSYFSSLQITKWEDIKNNPYYKIIYGQFSDPKAPNEEFSKQLLMDIVNSNYRAITIGYSDQYADKPMSKELAEKIVSNSLENKEDIIKLNNYQATLDITETKRAVPYSSSLIRPLDKGRFGAPKNVKIAFLDPRDRDLSNFSGITSSYDTMDGLSLGHPLHIRRMNNSFGSSGVGIDHLKTFGELFHESLGTSALMKNATFTITSEKLRDSAFNSSDSILTIFKRMSNIPLGKNSRMLYFKYIEKVLEGRDYPTFTLSTLIDNPIYNILYKKNEKGEEIVDGLGNKNAIVKINKISIAPNDQFVINTSILYKAENGNPEIREINVYQNIDSIWDFYNLLGGSFTTNAQTTSVENAVYNSNTLDILGDALEQMALDADAQEKDLDINAVNRILNYGYIEYAAFTSAVKTGVANKNSLSQEFADSSLNFSVYDGSHHGIQGNFDHLTSEADISNPTQIVSLISQGNYTYETASQLYNDLAELINIKFEESGLDFTSVTDSDSLVEFFINVYKDGNVLSGANAVAIKENVLSEKFEEFKGFFEESMPYSSSDIYSNLFSNIISAINRAAIKIKMPGNANVLHPSQDSQKFWSVYNEETGKYDRLTTSDLLSKGETAQSVLSKMPKISFNEIQVGSTYAVHFKDGNVEAYEILSFQKYRDFINYLKENAENINTVTRHFQENLLPQQIYLISKEGQRYSIYNIPEVREAFLLRELVEIQKKEEVDLNLFKTNIQSLALIYNKTGNAKNTTKLLNSYIAGLYESLSKGETITLSDNDVNDDEATISLYEYTIEINNAEAVMSNGLASKFNMTEKDSVNSANEETFTRRNKNKFEKLMLNNSVKVTSETITRTLVNSDNGFKINYQASTSYDQYSNSRDITSTLKIISRNGKKYYQYKGYIVSQALLDLKVFQTQQGIAVVRRNSDLEQANSEIINIIKNVLNNQSKFDFLISPKEDFDGNNNKINDVYNYKEESDKFVDLDVIHLIKGNDGHNNLKAKELTEEQLISFKEYLQITSGRIPAQNMQSVMSMTVIAFNGSKNASMFVNPMQLFLQGSDLDIDKSYTLYKAINSSGKLYKWSPFFSTNEEVLKILVNLPLKVGSKKSQENALKIFNDSESNIINALEGVKPKGITKKLNELLNSDSGVQIAKDLVNVISYYDSNNSVTNTKIKLIIDIYQNYLLNKERLAEGIKNKILYSTHFILKDIRNLPSTMEPISMDESKSVIKEDQSKQLTAANPDFVSNITSANMSGSENISRLAVGLKTLYSVKEYLGRLPENQRMFSGGKAILYYPTIDSNGEMSPNSTSVSGFKVFSNPNYKAYNDLLLDVKNNQNEYLNDSKKLGELIFNVMAYEESDHAFKLLSELLSLSTDNAKELALSKLNADPIVSSFYIFGISIGVPHKTLYNFMTSPYMLLFKKFASGNIMTNKEIFMDLTDAADSFQVELLDEDSEYHKEFIKAIPFNNNTFSTIVNNFTESVKSILSIQNSFVWLGRTLSINQGMKSKPEEFMSFMDSFIQEYNSKKDDDFMGFSSTILNPDIKDIKLRDYSESEKAVSLPKSVNFKGEYEFKNSKPLFNPYEILFSNPHYAQMMSIMAITDKNLNSKIFRYAYQRRLANLVKGNFRLSKKNYIKIGKSLDASLLKIFLSLYKDNPYKKIEFIKPENERYLFWDPEIQSFVVQSNEMNKTLESMDYVYIKQWIENTFLKHLKSIESYKTNNLFVKSLSLAEHRNIEQVSNFRKTVSLGLDFTNVDIENNTQFKQLAEDFNIIANVKISEVSQLRGLINDEKNLMTIGDVFRLYTMMTYRQRSGQHSMQKLLEYADNTAQIKSPNIYLHYLNFISKLDAENYKLSYLHESYNKVMENKNVDIKLEDLKRNSILFNIISEIKEKGLTVTKYGKEDLFEHFVEGNPDISVQKVFTLILHDWYQNSVFNKEFEPYISKNKREFIKKSFDPETGTNYKSVIFDNTPFDIFNMHSVLPVGLPISFGEKIKNKQVEGFSTESLANILMSYADSEAGISIITENPDFVNFTFNKQEVEVSSKLFKYIKAYLILSKDLGFIKLPERDFIENKENQNKIDKLFRVYSSSPALFKYMFNDVKNFEDINLDKINKEQGAAFRNNIFNVKEFDTNLEFNFLNQKGNVISVNLKFNKKEKKFENLELKPIQMKYIKDLLEKKNIYPNAEVSKHWSIVKQILNSSKIDSDGNISITTDC